MLFTSSHNVNPSPTTSTSTPITVQLKNETTLKNWPSCHQEQSNILPDHVSSSNSSEYGCDNKEFTKNLDESQNSSPCGHTLSIRMLMSGKEVGSIIGKRGENVKKYREESGARINISDGSCPERIVTVIGNPDQIAHAYSMICLKFEDDFTQSLQRYNYHGQEISCPPVTLRLLVPATQCGSIIGKGGCKIKDIRELTGASIQVAIEILPQSSERTVTVSGTAKAISRCIRQLCEIIQQTPLKGTAIPYRPKPVLPDGVHQSQPQTPTMIGTNPLMNALAVAAGVDQKKSSVQLSQANSQSFVEFPMNPRQNSIYASAMMGFGSPQPVSQPQFSNSQLDPVQISDCLSGTGTNSTAVSKFEENSSSDLSRSLIMDTSTAGHLMNNLSYNPSNHTATSNNNNSQLLASICPLLFGQDSTSTTLLDVSQNANLCASANFYNPLNGTQALISSTPSGSSQDYLSSLLATTPTNNNLNYLSISNIPPAIPVPSKASFKSSIPGIINEAYMINPNGDHRYELIITNDLIGCIIGRGGNKINEIRQLSLATIKISSCEDGVSDRKISITGSPQCVHMAHILIMNSILSRESAEFLMSLPTTSLPPQQQVPFQYAGPFGQASHLSHPFQSTLPDSIAAINFFRQFPLLMPVSSNNSTSGSVTTTTDQCDPSTFTTPLLFPTAPMTVQY